MYYDLKKVTYILLTLYKQSWLIAIAAILGLLVSFLFTSDVQSDVYTANVTIYAYTDLISIRTIMQDNADMIRSTKIAELAANTINGERESSEFVTSATVKSMVSVNYSEGSSIMTISSSSVNHDISIIVANAVADAFVKEMNNITGRDVIRVLDNASGARITYNGKAEQMKKRVIFVMGSTLAVAAFIVLKLLFSVKIQTISDASLNGEIEILGVIPKKNI